MSIACVVHVDGHRLPDTPADYEAGRPTGLDGLAIRWGRDTTADQPACAACTFTVADPDGDASFLDVLRVGATVTVDATALVPGPGQAMAPGAFDPDTPGVRVDLTPAPDTLTRLGTSATWRLARTAHAGTLDVLPAPRSAVPGAWDDLPRLAAAQAWTVSLHASWPAGMTLTYGLAVIPGPAGPATGWAGPPVPAGPGPGSGPRSAIVHVDAGHDGAFAGLAVTVDTAGALAGSWADVDPATTWPGADTGSWAFLPALTIADPDLTAPAAWPASAQVFTGTITDLNVSPGEAGGSVVDVTASDLISRLANIYLGQAPWPAETMGARAARILAAAATADPAGPHVGLRVDTRPGALAVSWRDVDNASAAALISDLATSTDAIAWPAAHDATGAYVWLEDPAARVSLAYLALDPDGVLTIHDGRTGVLHLSACDLLRDEASWVQDTSEVITRVDLTWLEQTLDDEGKPAPTERHVQLVDTLAETRHGVRRAGISTELATAAGAQAVAAAVLARADDTRWRVSALTWDTTDTSEVAAVLALLDVTRRIGLPMVITDLPHWSPLTEDMALYLEGGAYTYTLGAWVLDLAGSPSGSAGASATWAELAPPWRWRDVDPAISWRDLTGVAAGP